MSQEWHKAPKEWHKAPKEWRLGKPANISVCGFFGVLGSILECGKIVRMAVRAGM